MGRDAPTSSNRGGAARGRTRPPSLERADVTDGLARRATRGRALLARGTTQPKTPGLDHDYSTGPSTRRVAWFAGERWRPTESLTKGARPSSRSTRLAGGGRPMTSPAPRGTRFVPVYSVAPPARLSATKRAMTASSAIVWVIRVTGVHSVCGSAPTRTRTWARAVLHYTPVSDPGLLASGPAPRHGGRPAHAGRSHVPGRRPDRPEDGSFPASLGCPVAVAARPADHRSVGSGARGWSQRSRAFRAGRSLIAFIIKPARSLGGTEARAGPPTRSGREPNASVRAGDNHNEFDIRRRTAVRPVRE